MKLKLFVMTLFFFLPLVAAAQTADEIVKKALDARGGAEKIRAVQSERIAGHLSSARGVEGGFVLELKRPYKMHTEISVEGQKIVRVYDGKSAGWMINPFAENKDVQTMSPEDLKGITDESDMDGPLVDYKSKGHQVELIGKEDLDGKPVYRLKLTTRSGDVRSYLIDASTFLTTKWEGLRKIEDKDLPWESLLSDYRDVQGLKYPFKIEQGSPGTDFRQTLTTEKIEIDPPLDESRFAKPPSPVPPADAPVVPPTPPSSASTPDYHRAPRAGYAVLN
jgi:outer membrane lipoprotein-sorting protein